MFTTPSFRMLVRTMFVCVLCILPQTVFSEKIDSFDADITVHQDATISVVETIRYNFEGAAERHGIYRDIPKSFTDTAGTKHTLSFTDVVVTDEKGIQLRQDISSVDGMERIRIGDPDVFVDGVHIYKIAYRAFDAIAYLPDRDDLYWNVTGNGWTVPIGSAHTVVRVDGVPATTNLEVACYEGARGATERCAVEKVSTSTTAEYAFSGTRAYAPYEGMTVAVGIPKGVVTQPAVPFWKQFLEKYFPAIDRALGAGVFLLVVGLAYREWVRHGRDPKGRGTIVAQYEPISDLSVLESAFLVRHSLKNSDISAGIIELATKGALRIVEETTSVLMVFSKKTYRLERINGAQNLMRVEQELLDILFDPDIGAVGGSLLLTDVKPRAAQECFTTLKKYTGTSLVGKGYFTKNPYNAYGWLRYVTVALAISVVSIFILWVAVLQNIVNFPLWTIVGCALAAVFCEIFAYLMPQKTKKGAEARETLLGLKQYIGVAEKARLEFHNAPVKTPALFEKLLPYALLFGLSDIWVDEFMDIMKQPPSWYSSPSGTFNAAAFSSGISDFNSAFAASSTPTSSGSSGGGFSGGGGGGGGGGSW